jgi:hypothetical protein
MSSRNQYKISWVNIIFVFIIALGIVSIVVGAVIMLFIGIMRDLKGVALLPVIFIILLWPVFFINIQFWTNVMYYPVQRWIKNNIICEKCGSHFTSCEHVMEHPWAFVSSVCYCKRCAQARVIETGTFSRILTFNPNRSIEVLYEQKYQHETYKIPSWIWAMYMVTLFITPVVVTFLAYTVPLMIASYYYGSSRVVIGIFQPMKSFYFYGLLFLCNTLYLRVKGLRNFATYPIRLWIRTHVNCPECNVLLENCDLQMRRFLFNSFNYFNSFTGYCKNCKKQRRMQIGGFDWLLRLVSHD